MWDRVGNGKLVLDESFFDYAEESRIDARLAAPCSALKVACNHVKLLL